MNTVKTNFRPTILSQSIAAILLCGSLLAPAAHAARVDIPAGSLDHAIQLLAQQTGIVIAADGQQTRQFKAPAIRGDLSASQALQQLLRGSTLEAIQQKDGSYLLRPLTELPKVRVSATAPAESSGRTVADGVNEAQLETVRVSAAANLGGSEATATSPVKGYVAKRSATATKTDTPIVETPQSITVIGQNEMRARDVQSVSEARTYMPGIQVANLSNRSYDFGKAVIRGFQETMSYRDGFPSFNREYISPNEPYSIERIENLRGPVSSIYGFAEAGGITHLVSKRPQIDQTQEVGINAGNNGQLGVRADLGGQIEDVQWRLVSSASRIDNVVRYPGNAVAKRDTLLVAPSLSMKLGENSKLTIHGEYLDKEGPGAHPYEIKTGLPMGEPSFDGRIQKQWHLGYELTHQLDSKWSISHNARVSKLDNPQRAAYRANPNQTGLTSQAFAAKFNMVDSNQAVDIKVSGRINTGEAIHNLLIGLDYMNSKGSVVGKAHTVQPININNPVYGLPVIDDQKTSFDESSELNAQAIFAQDQVSIDRWRFTGGLRLDRVKHERTNRLAGTSSTTNDTALTGRIGVNYLFDNGFAPYISYGTSFSPQTGSDRNGKHFDPTEGQQYEAGVRYQPQNGKGMVSAAVYQLTKSNVLTADPRNTPGESFEIATGEIRARGLELEARIEPLAGLNLIANYSYNPMKVTRSNGTDLGKSPAMKSKHLASAWVDYTVQGGSLRGVGFGLGARYTGPQFKDQQNTQSLAGRTSYDAAISYKYGQWQTRLNATNLTNARPVVDDAWGIHRAAARTVNLDVSYKF